MMRSTTILPQIFCPFNDRLLDIYDPKKYAPINFNVADSGKRKIKSLIVKIRSRIINKAKVILNIFLHKVDILSSNLYIRLNSLLNRITYVV